MSSDETPKIEPKMSLEPTLILNDAPPIAAVDQPPAIDAKAEIEAPKADAKIEPKIEPKQIEPKSKRCRPPHRSRRRSPRSSRSAAPIRNPKWLRPRRPQRRVPDGALRCWRLAWRSRRASARSAVRLGVAKLGPMFAEAKPPVLPVAKDHVADEVKALKDTVAQLRTTTKSLSDNLAALKTSVNTSNTAQNTQIGKIAETLDRVEKSQAEQRKTAAAQQQHSRRRKPPARSRRRSRPPPCRWCWAIRRPR